MGGAPARVVVTGASGTIGTSVLAALEGDPAVQAVVAVARRRPDEIRTADKVRWFAADVAREDLAAAFAGAEAVVHLARALNPSRDRQQLRRVNVEGSQRVFEAARAAGHGRSCTRRRSAPIRRVRRTVSSTSPGLRAASPASATPRTRWPSSATSTSWRRRTPDAGGPLRVRELASAAGTRGPLDP